MNPQIIALKGRISEYRASHPPVKQPEQPKRHTRQRQKTLLKLKPNTYCYYCGEPLTEKNATLDHIIPLSRGGSNAKYNKVWACKACNLQKSDKLLHELKADKFKHPKGVTREMGGQA